MNHQALFDLPLDVLDRIVPDASWSIGDFVAAACLLEAAAPKAGNVHPGACFADMNYEDFRRSARTIAEVFEQSKHSTCGSLVLAAVEATQNALGKNTNLGIILLIAPLIIAVRPCLSSPVATFRESWKTDITSTLKSLTANDSLLTYRAISLAKPGGIGRVDRMDIEEAPPTDLISAMQLASAWDDVAKQYATNFLDVFALSERLDTYRQSQHHGWFHSINIVQIERLASHGDSLIARKTGSDTVEEVKKLAVAVLRSTSLASNDITLCHEWKRLDDFLRAEGHRRNPGTTADLLSAAALVSLVSESKTANKA